MILRGCFFYKFKISKFVRASVPIEARKVNALVQGYFFRYYVMLNKVSKQNPYLGTMISHHLYYLNKENFDSAYKYSKLA